MSAGVLARGRATALWAAWLVAAAAIGAFAALLSYQLHPLAPLAALAAVALLAVSATRPEFGVAAALLLLPLGRLGYVPGAQFLVTGLASYLVAVVVLTRRASGPPALALPAVIFLVAMIIGYAVSPEVAGRQQLRTIVTSLALFYVTAVSVRDRGQWVVVLMGLAFATLAMGLAAAYEGASGGSQTGGFVTSGGEIVARVTGGFVSPNQLAGYLVVLAPLMLVGILIQRRGWVLYLPALALASFGVYVSFSRGALIGLALVPFVFLRGRHLLAAIPVVAVLLIGFTPTLLQERFATLTSSGSEIATRVDIWKTAVAVWQSAPVAGAGLGSFPNAYAEARVPGKKFLPQSKLEPPPHAHNLALQMLAETGLLGLLALLGVLSAAVTAAARLRRASERWIQRAATGIMASLLAFLVHNVFDVTLFQSETGAVFWVTLGLLAALVAMARPATTPAS